MINKIISIQYSGYFFKNLDYETIKKIREEKENLIMKKMFEEKSEKIKEIQKGNLINILV